MADDIEPLASAEEVDELLTAIGRRPAVADDSMCTPDEWESAPVEGLHDHKGHSEEKCVRCGWVMGHRPLNCMNDNTPHRFPSQEAEIERLREIAEAADQYHDVACNPDWCRLCRALNAWREAHRA